MKWSRRNTRRVNRETPRRVLIRQILFGTLTIFLVTGLGYGVWWVTHLPGLNIDEVQVSGGETLSHGEVKNIVEKQLSGEYVRLIPKRFVWTYPEEAILQSLEEIDRIKNIKINRENQSLSVYFEEYQPFALWCGSVDTDCMFIDQEGFAFAKAPWLEGSSFVRYREKEREPEKRVAAFSPEFIQATKIFINSVYDQLGFNITEVEKTGMEEIIYYVVGGGEIKVSSRMSTDETLQNLGTILGSQEFSHLEPGNFRYVDLRYGNKVFVNETFANNKETATSTQDVTAIISASSSQLGNEE